MVSGVEVEISDETDTHREDLTHFIDNMGEGLYEDGLIRA